MKFKSLIFSILLLIFLAFAEAKPPELTPHLTRKKSEEIFKAHVTYKKLTPDLAHRILQNYLEELDATKTYLLESEVATWDSPSEELLNQLVSNYRKENFVTFDEIYETMITAIERRNRLESEIADQDLPETSVNEFKDLKWATTEAELKERLLKLRALQLETAEKLDFETKDQFIQRINKRRISREQEILQENLKDRHKQQLAYFLKAFTGALDNHTVYFTPTEANQFMIQVQQRLFGIGAQLRDDLNGFTLVRLIEGGPATREGKLKVNDRVIAVNHEPVVGMDIVEAVELIRGPKGTAVTLTILREHGEETPKKTEKLDIEIIRDEIVLKETRFESETVPYGDGVIGHIRLFSFYQDPNYSSAADLKKAMEEMKEKHNLKGVVLDLRNNAGGILPQAVAVTGLFIKKGIVVSIKDSNGNIQHLRNFESDLTWDGPLLVLTNKGSASAAEIVAQTLQDYGRAVLVGDPSTWGKGSYQTFTLDSSNANTVNPQGEYKVTRGLYYTVSGKSPQLTGTKVDIEVPGGLTEAEIGEAQAKFPLENDEISPNFQDNLSDIHPFHRGKMMRYYKKDLQERMTIYEPYMTTLKSNSQIRVQNNTNYQNFLKEIKKEEFDAESVEKYGQNDLQLEETMNIMKDLVLLSEQKEKAEAPKTQAAPAA
ncbi:S41 family peptidase [Simkania sp.]|uniref:tail-specific protease Tsp n=1 Tax=Simkania sp. TaxID=34094 RepID=UPI003B51C1F8